MPADRKGRGGNGPARGTRRHVVDARKVAGFTPAEHRGSWVSRLLIDGESVGSTNIVLNHFTIMPGHRTYPGSHPEPYEEVYYVLSGSGVLTLGGEGGERHELGPHVAAYIPAGMVHELVNTGAVALEMLTMMPFHPTPGVNSVYDARRREWGTSFKVVEDEEAHQ